MHTETILAYIDQNLKTDITAGELASMAGYSLWHFCRLFSQAIGMPVTAYISKRRLDKALLEISSGRKSADVAPEYGFDTYAGFYKAFTRMYGCSPRKYLSLYGEYKSKISGGFCHMKEHELRQLLTHWDVPHNLPISDIYIMDGAKISGNVWRLGNEYILKTGLRDQMLKNIRVTKALTAQGFTAAALIPTKSGAEYLDGEQITALTHRLPGAPLPKEDRFGDDRYEFGCKYGQAIAKLHNALAEAEPHILPDEANLYKQVTEWALPNVEKQNQQWNMGLLEEFFADYITGFGELFDKLPKQLIHRDPNPSNILFHGGEVSGFIDFDFSEKNVRLWDICYCATGILSEWRGVDDIQEKWPLVLKGILHGYDSVNPLTPEEKQAVYYVICSIEMVCLAYFATVDWLHEVEKTNREMLTYIVSRRTEIEGIFS